MRRPGSDVRLVRFDSYKVYPGAYEREIRIKPIDLRKQSH